MNNNEKILVLNRSEKDKTVYICFAKSKDHKIISQEEAIFEEEEFYKIMERWLVKFENKDDRYEALLNNTVDDDEAILLQRELAGEEVESDGQ